MAVNERQYNMNVQQIRQILISGPDKFAPPEQISTGKMKRIDLNCTKNQGSNIRPAVKIYLRS